MNLVYYAIYYFFNILFSFMPKFMAMGFLSFVAKVAYKVDKKHRNIILQNLKISFKDTKTKDELDKITKNVYKNFAKFAYSFIKNQNTTKEKILKQVRFKNEEILTNLLQEKQKIILQTAHYGNWELLSLSIAAKFGSLSGVGRPLDSPLVDVVLSKNRTQFNIELIDKKNGLRKMLKALQNGRILGVLVDQSVALKEGRVVEFFGNKVTHTPALSIIAKKTNAIIVPTFIQKIDDNLNEICFYKPLDSSLSVDELTQAQASITQKIIAQKPDEYFWFHKRYKSFYKEIYK